MAATERRPRAGARLLPASLAEVRAVLLSLLLGALAWEAAGRWLEFAFLPPLSRVLPVLAALWGHGELPRHLLNSLSSLAVGFGLAVALGLPIGALMGRYRLVERALDLYLYVFLASPTLLYVPVLFAIFGVSRASQTAVVFLYAFFVLVSNTMAAVRTARPALLDMARAFGADERRLLWRVRLPAGLPLLMAGLRIAAGRAVKGMVNGEMLIALSGIGAMLRSYGGRFDIPGVYAILLVVVGVAAALNAALQAVERRLNRWQPQGGV